MFQRIWSSALCLASKFLTMSDVRHLPHFAEAGSTSACCVLSLKQYAHVSLKENSWDGCTSYGSTYLCKMGWTHTFQQIFSRLHFGAVTNWTLAGGQLLRTLQVENMSACLASALSLGPSGWNWANSSGSPSPVCPLPRGKPIWTHYKPARLKVCDSDSWMPFKHCLAHQWFQKEKLVFLHTGTAKQLKHLSKKTTSPSEIAYEQTAEAPVPDKLRIRWPPLPSLPPAYQAWESWMRSQHLCVRNCELRCATSYHQLNDFKTSLALAASYRLACPSDSTPCRWQRKALGVGTGEWDAAKGMWASPLTVHLVVYKSSVLVICAADSQKSYWSSFVYFCDSACIQYQLGFKKMLLRASFGFFWR